MLNNFWLKPNINQPFTLNLHELIKLIKNKKINPKIIIKSYINRINEKNNHFRAISSIDEKYIYDQFDKLHPNSSLSYIPVGIKDIYNTERLPTEMGSPIYKNFYSGNDARVVTNLKREGCIVFCKTETAEFAVHHPGPTKNAYSSKHICGTSSSGSAVAVATGMLPFALGSQTAASTIRPAAYNGVYGFKPSFGVIPRTGTLKTLDTLDHVTFFSRSSTDLRIIFDALRVKGKNYPLIYKNYDQIINKIYLKSKKPSIGFINQKNIIPTDTVQYNLIQKFKFNLKKNGFKIIDLDFDKLFKDKHLLHQKIYSRGLAYYFKEEFENNKKDLSKIFIKMINEGNKIKLSEYRELINQQQLFIKKINVIFKNVDFVISSSTFSEAPLKNSEEKKDISLIWTLSHLPSVNIPFIKKNKLPRGIQIVSKKYDDYKLFEFLEILKKKNIIKDVPVINNY